MAHPSDADGEAETSLLNNTRRQFVVGSAGVVGGLAAGGALTGSALAQQEDDETTEEAPEGDEETMAESDFEDDVAILNYARTLEFLEASFYKEGLDNIGEEGIMECGMTGDDDDPLWESAYDELRTIQEHEETHVEALGTAIENLGGEPVEEPEFDFGLRTEYAEVFIATAAQLEDLGVAAYAGAAPHFENEELLPPALSIHSVEARHASFLRTLAGDTSFPEAFDPAQSRPEVLEIAGMFIVDPDAPESEDEPEMPAEDDTETAAGNETGTGNETEPMTGSENGTSENGTTGNGTTDTPVNETTTAQ